MTEQELIQEITSLKEKLLQNDQQFENYKKEAKQMEDFLQAEADKKQTEIRKLKEQAILKEKNFKLLKVEVSQLLSQTASLRAQLANGTPRDINPSAQELFKLKDQNLSLHNANSQLTKDILKQKQAISKLEKYNKELDAQWVIKYDKLIQQQASSREYIWQLQQDKDKLTKQLAELQLKISLSSSLKSQTPLLQLKNSKKQIIPKQQPNFDKERDKYQEKLRKLQQINNNYQKIIKQQKNKIQTLLEEKQRLQQKLKDRKSSALIMSSPSAHKLSITKQQNELQRTKISWSCLLLTKYHYLSPFLQIHEDKNVIQMYKYTRTGCFQKSVGSTRHRFDHIGFKQEDILNPLFQKIINSPSSNHHSIIIYGVKKSSKKYLMAKIMLKLQRFLTRKLEDASGHVETVFLKRSVQQDKNFTFRGLNKDAVVEAINMVLALGNKKQKRSDKHRMLSPKKILCKPKVRYFSMKLDDFSLQLGTSSFTGLVLRDKASASNMLNNIFYSKLPDILQSTISQKHLILVVNPIVDLYEDCKNTLSITLCKSVQAIKEEEELREWKGHPVREELNSATKKKVDILQRQNEQTSIKIKKLQEQIGFYRARFDELQCRLKNLLNTHSGQNLYLKKSPVTLSYQRLLKFVHSIQTRTSSLIGVNASPLRAIKLDNSYDSIQIL